MRHKVFEPFDTHSGDLTLSHEDQLMNQAFKNAGYMTMTAGKWHLGHTHVRDFPINRGLTIPTVRSRHFRTTGPTMARGSKD